MSTFISFDGVEIFYQEWGESSALPPVVLHHGFIADANLNWVATGVVDKLVAAGRRVVAPDARGHGRSGKPHDPAFYGESKMAGDLAVLLDTIGAEEADLVGYSMGAIVSLITATQEPRIRRLVVGGVGAGIVEVGGVDTRAIPNELLAEALLTDDPSTITHPGAANFRAFADAIQADRRALAAQARSVHAERIPVERINAPTLVLAGTEDPLAERPQVLSDAIPGARLLSVPGDHMGALRAAEFVPALVEFLA